MAIVKSNQRQIKAHSNTKSRYVQWFLIVLAVAMLALGQQHPIESIESIAIASLSGQETSSTSLLPAAFSAVLQKTRGKNWKAWSTAVTSESSILHADKGFGDCRWSKYTAQYDPTKSMEVCLHPAPDVISDIVNLKGYWEDCFAVSRQWYAAANSTSNIHIEIGANIGSCIFELLLSDPNAHIVAFEPQAKNLFRLTSTLQRASPQLSKRVVVLPIALGANGGGIVQLADGAKDEFGKPNYGGNFISTEKDNNNNNVEEVAIERLDDILSAKTAASTAGVRLLKMDAQGFECNIMAGMDTCMPPQRIVTEIEEESLKRAGCSGEELVQRLADRSYQSFRYRAATGNLLATLPKGADFSVVAIAKQP